MSGLKLEPLPTTPRVMSFGTDATFQEFHTPESGSAIVPSPLPDSTEPIPAKHARRQWEVTKVETCLVTSPGPAFADISPLEVLYDPNIEKHYRRAIIAREMVRALL